VSGIETIALSASAGDYIITTADATVASGKTLTISSASRTGNLNFDGSAETNGSFSITTGTGVDTIKGGAGADTITAGTGADTITGGAGADVIDLGSDTDVDAVMFAGGGYETGSLEKPETYEDFRLAHIRVKLGNITNIEYTHYRLLPNNTWSIIVSWESKSNETH
jgi:hypothetical protein